MSGKQTHPLILPKESPPSLIRWMLLKIPGLFIISLYIGTLPSMIYHCLIPLDSAIHSILYFILFFYICQKNHKEYLENFSVKKETFDL